MAETKQKIGGTHFVEVGTSTYAIRMGIPERMNEFLNFSSTAWDSDPVTVAGVRVIPWGIDNNLPTKIRNLLEKNNLGPGILDRKTGLLYGQGPMLYQIGITDNERVQKWVQDNEIQDWLDSWDYKRFIRDAFVEYTHAKGLFAKYYTSKSVRIGKARIARLECLPASDCRLVWNEERQLDGVKQILVGDFTGSYSHRDFRLYPVFDKWNPTAAETAIKYHNMRSFGRNMYAISSFYGSIPWLENANNLPEIIRYLNENMIAAAYMVHQPAAYWKQKEEQIRMMYPDYTDLQYSKEIEKLQDKIIRNIADVMAGRKNAGKFFTSVDFLDENGHKQEWKIEPIEMNIDKYIKAQAEISRIADSSTTSGFGLNPALANIIIDGKGDSGSQMLYALKIFYGADTQIPEEVALEAVNDAIRINFPEKKGIFLGIYRKIINKEDNVSAKSRATNQE
jgi:hypothetical protein